MGRRALNNRLIYHGRMVVCPILSCFGMMTDIVEEEEEQRYCVADGSTLGEWATIFRKQKKWLDHQQDFVLSCEEPEYHNRLEKLARWLKF